MSKYPVFELGAIGTSNSSHIKKAKCGKVIITRPFGTFSVNNQENYLRYIEYPIIGFEPLNPARVNNI